jgi:putative ABC transport system ATP-binding protein
VETLIEVTGLSHRYGDGALRRRVLADVALRVTRGEIVMVTGPSGSGKSTLLTVLGALRAPQTGSVRVLGEELAGASPQRLARVRRGIGYVFQQHGLLDALSASENVELPLLLAHPALEAGARRAWAGELLASVGLGGQAAAAPRQLSTGQRQRVAIARALAGDPALVLADEPTAALDGQTGRDAMVLLHDLARRHGCAVVVVTHDPRIVDLADRVVALDAGRLVEATAPAAGLDDTSVLLQRCG